MKYRVILDRVITALDCMWCLLLSVKYLVRDVTGFGVVMCEICQLRSTVAIFLNNWRNLGAKNWFSYVQITFRLFCPILLLRDCI